MNLRLSFDMIHESPRVSVKPRSSTESGDWQNNYWYILTFIQIEFSVDRIEIVEEIEDDLHL